MIVDSRGLVSVDVVDEVWRREQLQGSTVVEQHLETISPFTPITEISLLFHICKHAYFSCTERYLFN